MIYAQRTLMRKLFAEHEGNRGLVLEAYAAADERGEVRRARNSNGVSSREYAIRLWANGMHVGWLSGGKGAPPKSAIGANRILNEAVEIFEEPLAQMGRLWREDPSRPRPSEPSLDYWRSLVAEWCERMDLPLLVRKGGHRGILGKLPSGRKFVRCDNSPAHWAFMGCCAGEHPTLDEVSCQITSGQLPVAMARTRAEKLLVEAGSHTAWGGFISRSKYGQVNRFTDGRAYKLCHLKPVGLGSRGEVEEFEEAALKEHMRLLLDPSNMIVVPLRYAGVGECQAFLDAFIREPCEEI
jgi:hypothetical protein